MRQNAYSDPGKLTAAMSWQDTFHKSRSRLRDMFGSCRDMHIEPSVEIWISEEQRRDFLEAVSNIVQAAGDL